MKVIEVKIIGTSPLLMNKYTLEKEETKKKKQYDEQEQALKKLYTDSNGKVVQPSEHIERAMQKAGVNHKYTGRKTYSNYLKAGIEITPLLIPHLIQKWAVDTRAVVIKGSGRIPRSRPILNEWALKFTINVLNEDLSVSALQDILTDAGKFEGIGDYRPKFGRFRIESFKELK